MRLVGGCGVGIVVWLVEHLRVLLPMRSSVNMSAERVCMVGTNVGTVGF